MDRKQLTILFLFITFILFPTCSFATQIFKLTPENLATDVALDTIIAIEFDGEMAWNNDLINDGLTSVILSVESTDLSHSFEIYGDETAAVRTGKNPVIGVMDRGWIEFSLVNPLHALRSGLTYTATLSGAINTDSQTLDPYSWEFTTQLTGPPVQVASFAPIKSFGTVVLDATGKFYDPEGGPLAYNWFYILRGAYPGFNGSASGVTATLTDLKPGFYDVILQVTNEDNETVQTSLVIFIDIGPVGDFNSDGDIDGQDLVIFSNAFGH